MNDATSKISEGKPDWDEYFLAIAEAVATRSSCTRRKVGAVLVGPDRKILATGYNDAPHGKPGCEGCPRSRPENSPSVAANASYDSGGAGGCGAIHAEQNVLLDVPRSATRGATLYITEEPCPWCEKLISAVHLDKVRTPTHITYFEVKMTVKEAELEEDSEPERLPHDVAADIFNGGLVP